MASLERTKKEVVNEIISDAKRRNPDGKRPLVVLMDGVASMVVAGIGFKRDGIYRDIRHNSCRGISGSSKCPVWWKGSGNKQWCTTIWCLSLKGG